MNIDSASLTWLIVGALTLSVLAVVVDRVNFPQKPFRPKRIETGTDGPNRDRTGAHLLVEDEEPGDPANTGNHNSTG